MTFYATPARADAQFSVKQSRRVFGYIRDDLPLGGLNLCDVSTRRHVLQRMRSNNTYLTSKYSLLQPITVGFYIY